MKIRREENLRFADEPSGHPGVAGLARGCNCHISSIEASQAEAEAAQAAFCCHKHLAEIHPFSGGMYTTECSNE
jgi:hypothetical protein